MQRKLEMKIEAISLSPRTLRVGHLRILSPSQGWLGIEEGIVQVQKIVLGSDTVVPLCQIEMYNEMELESDDRGEPIDFSQEYWIEYTYKKTGSCHWLPLIIFEDHISAW